MLTNVYNISRKGIFSRDTRETNLKRDRESIEKHIREVNFDRRMQITLLLRINQTSERDMDRYACLLEARRDKA